MTGLYNNVELRIVKMGGNKITSVSSLETLRNLESLDISNNKISLLEDLRCLSFNIHLKNLWLVGNPVAKYFSMHLQLTPLITKQVARL
jgi:Leucine-rich repeat (LRR) protein